MSAERLKKNIKSNKYFEEKYHKNNYWSVAHYSSSAVCGYAGSCSTCKNKNYTLVNRRSKTHKGGGINHTKEVSSNYCGECFRKIQEMGFKFPLNHCP